MLSHDFSYTFRIEKEFTQRWGGIQAQREKAEAAHKREIDFLTGQPLGNYIIIRKR